MSNKGKQIQKLNDLGLLDDETVEKASLYLKNHLDFNNKEIKKAKKEIRSRLSNLLKWL